MKDPEFDDFLRSARSAAPLHDSFKRGVWQRIETAGESRWPQIARFQTVIAALVRPWGAATSIAAMVTLGLWLGAATDPGPKDSQMAYAESISPFAQAQGK